MRALLALVRCYFGGAPLQLALTVAGTLAIVCGTAAHWYLPPLVAQHGLPSRYSLGFETALLLLPVGGVLALFFGGSLLPTTFVRLATSHWAHVLPRARPKLLASAFMSVLAITVTATATVATLYVGLPADMAAVVRRAFVVSLLFYTLLYGLLWLVSRARTGLGMLGGALLMIAALSLPLRFIAVVGTPLLGPALATCATWGAIALVVVDGRAIARRAKRVLAHVGLDGGAGLAAEYAGGREVDLLLGTAQPWLIASAQLAPLALGAWLIAYPGVWLLYVTIVAVMIGAVSVPAAARSRALWLRGGWSRAALFRRVEQAFWRHNAYALGVSLLALTAVGSYLGLSSGTLALGIPLLVLATIISTYLGLVATRGIGPLDMVLAIGAMSMLMAAAVRAAEPAGRLPELALLGSALAATAFGLRWLAARRWRAIDWTACRPEPAATRARA